MKGTIWVLRREARPVLAARRTAGVEGPLACVPGHVPLGLRVGGVAVVLLGVIRGRAPPARATDRRRRATAEAVVRAAPLGVPSRGARQAPEAVAVAAGASDPGIAAAPVALVVAGTIPVATVLPPVLVQVPVVPLAVLATRLLSAVAACALAGASRVASRAGAVRQGVAPRPLGGIGATLSAVEAGALRVVAAQ